MVVLPSPGGVGLIAVTNTMRAVERTGCCSSQSRRTFAFVRPYGSSTSSGMPSTPAISAMGRSVAA